MTLGSDVRRRNGCQPEGSACYLPPVLPACLLPHPTERGFSKLEKRQGSRGRPSAHAGIDRWGYRAHQPNGRPNARSLPVSELPG